MSDLQKRKKLKRIDRDSQEWWRQANELARGFCPPIYPCADCGGPVVKGYCCNRCGSINPEGS